MYVYIYIYIYVREENKEIDNRNNKISGYH